MPESTDGVLTFAPALQDSVGFDSETFHKLADLEGGNFWFRARNSLVAWTLGHHFPDANRYLEVGCGTGFVLSGVSSAFPALEMCGSEVSVAGLTHAAARVPTGVQLFQMDARSIPYDREFDVVGAYDVIEHIAEDEEVLAQMFQACKPGGGILLTVPQHPFLWSRSDEIADHVRRYTKSELERKVSAAGFAIERSTSFVTVLFPAAVASRWFSRATDTDTADAEIQVSGLVNSLLETALRCEHVVIRVGVSLPFGLSRLLVGRKPA